ncbi:hemolytic protein HlpA-like protein [Candidatus Microgenomates bacterium]|nr:MAG: hemolytic protein HlpA-like protein [Candidatus Microgenomates bacterium]
MNMQTPVVLFIYKRASNLKAFCKILKNLDIKNIYIVSDGAKSIEYRVRVEKTRRELESLINWSCNVQKNYSDINLGLKERFRTGINWVFEHTDRAIFIEDDCIPDPSFFTYCDELLEKYKDDKRIISITGNNFQPRKNQVKDSYYFSRYPHVWGWATWKRVWDQYDSDIVDWPKLRSSGWLDKLFPDRFFTRKFWTYIFDRLHSEKINTWDYQLTYLSLKNSGFNIVPSVNLVSNVGYGDDATNIKQKNKTIAVPAKKITFPLKHPKNVVYNDRADKYIEELVYLNPLGKVSLFIKSLLGIL